MAALNVDKVFRFVQFVANKESRGWVSPAEFNIAAEIAQLTFYSELEGMYADTKQLAAFLRPFVNSSVSNSDQANLPTNFRLIISPYISEGEDNEYLPIDELELGEVPARMTSTVKPPSAKYPIIFIRSEKTWVLPNTIVFSFDYLETPTTTPTWAYTTTSGRPVYASGTSVNFQFDDAAFMEISKRILAHIGMNISKEEITQYAMASNIK